MKANKAVVGAAVAAVVLAGFGATGASAGEIKGTYKHTGELEYIAGDEEAHLEAASICAYSGLDEPDSLDLEDGDDDVFANTQNFGQMVKFFRQVAGVEGSTGGAGGACNPNSGGH